MTEQHDAIGIVGGRGAVEPPRRLQIIVAGDHALDAGAAARWAELDRVFASAMVNGHRVQGVKSCLNSGNESGSAETCTNVAA